MLTAHFCSGTSHNCDSVTPGTSHGFLLVSLGFCNFGDGFELIDW